MSNTSDKLREFVFIQIRILTALGDIKGAVVEPEEELINNHIERLTALISEGYVEKAKYDELLRQRDELREALLYLMDGVRGLPPLTAIVGVLEQQYIQAEAAIKNTER